MANSFGIANPYNIVNQFGVVNYPAGNTYAKFRDKYGVGPEDFGVRPYIQPYPQAYLPLPLTKDTFQKESVIHKLKRLANN